MKKYNLIFGVILILSTTLSGQTDSLKPDKDSTALSEFNTENYITKTGYNLAPLPEFMIDPFIGLYLGVYATVFDYGDGKKYPNYYRSLTLTAAQGTKGKTNFGLDFINYGKLILSAKVNYTRSTLFPFYGYNGYQTRYDHKIVDNTNDNYVTAPFYNYHQQVARMVVYIQDTIPGSFFNWKIGFDIAYYNTSRVNFDKLNKGVDENDILPDELTLYDHFVDWNIIKDDEKDGGWSNALTAAMVYDTRDRLTNPIHGIWTDITLRYSPDFLGNNHSAIQISATHRHYISLVTEKLSFAYRLRYDASIGKLPFYTRQVLADGTEGFGGTGTLWGILQNRIMTQQFAMGNFELRYKLFHFQFIKQNWHLAAVPLFHSGYLIEPLEMDLSALSNQERNTYFTSNSSNWYNSVGIGAKIVMNENTVIGFDWAHSLNKEAGENAIYVGFSYSF